VCGSNTEKAPVRQSGPVPIYHINKKAEQPENTACSAFLFFVKLFLGLGEN
jgi:hypothetical protein